ncbi:MAG: hypothetical protein GEU99_23515 [Luteitalea sp.]|nr:hypothetical protein [Luteitalea sp.]
MFSSARASQGARAFFPPAFQSRHWSAEQEEPMILRELVLTYRPTRDAHDRPIVTDETLRLESIIGDLLDLARLEGGGVAFERESVPVEWLFGRVAERHGTVLREKRIALDIQIAPNTQAVTGDVRRLEQALQNLAANAVRHTPVDGRVTLSAEAIDDQVRLRVRDTGPGIPAEHLPLIFDRFYKVDMARDHGSSGSGLGLSIVKAIVEGHGGTITASSPPEGGAAFEIMLESGHHQ